MTLESALWLLIIMGRKSPRLRGASPRPLIKIGPDSDDEYPVWRSNDTTQEPVMTTYDSMLQDAQAGRSGAD